MSESESQKDHGPMRCMCERGFRQPGCWEDEARGVYAEQMKEFHNISRETSDTHRFGSFIAAAIRDGERFTFCAEWSFDDASFTCASLKIERATRKVLMVFR